MCSCKVPDIFCSVLNKFGFSQQIFVRIPTPTPHPPKKESTKILPVFDLSLYRRSGRMTDMKKLMVLKGKYFAISFSRILHSSKSSIEN